MKSFVVLAFLGVSLFSQSAFCSFSSRDCSNPSGTILYHFFMSWNSLGNEQTWTIDGIQLKDEHVKISSATSKTELESWNNQMTGGRISAEKVALTFTVGGREKTVTDWLLCKTANGI